MFCSPFACLFCRPPRTACTCLICPLIYEVICTGSAIGHYRSCAIFVSIYFTQLPSARVACHSTTTGNYQSFRTSFRHRYFDRYPRTITLSSVCKDVSCLHLHWHLLFDESHLYGSIFKVTCTCNGNFLKCIKRCNFCSSKTHVCLIIFRTKALRIKELRQTRATVFFVCLFVIFYHYRTNTSALVSFYSRCLCLVDNYNKHNNDLALLSNSKIDAFSPLLCERHTLIRTL